MLTLVPIILGYVMLAGVRAGPLPPYPVPQRRAAPLATNQLSNLVPFTQFARAAYYEPKKIEGWKCGQACDALPGFEATLTGGDGNAVQFFFVGHWPQENTVVVAHQGTDPLELQAVLTDLAVLRGPLDPGLFPGIPSDVSVHTGFRDQHGIASKQILTEVQRLLAQMDSKKVVTNIGGPFTWRCPQSRRPAILQLL